MSWLLRPDGGRWSEEEPRPTQSASPSGHARHGLQVGWAMFGMDRESARSGIGIVRRARPCATVRNLDAPVVRAVRPRPRPGPAVLLARMDVRPLRPAAVQLHQAAD